MPPLTPEKAEEYMGQIHEEWMLIDGGRMLARQFEFKDFAEAMVFANQVAAIAEEEEHHPDLSISWGSVGVELMTHAIGGLTDNDFILAAKIDEIKK